MAFLRFSDSDDGLGIRDLFQVVTLGLYFVMAVKNLLFAHFFVHFW